MGSLIRSLCDATSRVVDEKATSLPRWKKNLSFFDIALFSSRKMEALLKPLMDKFEALMENESVAKYLNLLESKTNIKKKYLAYGTAVVVSWLMFGYGASLLCNVIGFVYPAYCSIKALESHDKDDDTQWLMYWVVFSVFSVLEFFSDILMGWIPFYWLTKCVFLVWCMSPANGSELIYRKLVLPWFKANQTNVDKVIDQGKKYTGLMTQASNLAQDAVSAVAAEARKDQ